MERFLTVSFHCRCHWKWRVSESRGWLQAFWENSLPGSLSSSASLLCVFMSTAALTETLIHKGWVADSRLTLTACAWPDLGNRGNKQYSHTCWAGSQVYAGMLLKRKTLRNQLQRQIQNGHLLPLPHTHRWTPFPCLSWKRAQHSCSCDV